MSIKTFNEFLQETSLSRQWYHFTDVKHEAGIMSAFRAQYRDRPEVQAARTLELAGKISSAGFGYVFADGHFVEEGPNGTKIPVEEKKEPKEIPEDKLRQMLKIDKGNK